MYFSKLPRVTYNYLDINEDIQKKIAIDITTRVKIAEYISNYRNNFNDYTIKDGERPDTLADKLYDKSDLHWIFFITNNMINPYESWPRSSRELKSFIDEKYSGFSLFVPDIWKPRLNLDNEYEYSIAYTSLDNIEDYNLGFFKESLTTKQLLGIMKSTKVKVFIENGMYEVDVKKINSEFYEIRVEKGNWSTDPSITNSYVFFEIENFGKKITVRAPITRAVQEGRYAVHNFELDGEYRDPNQAFESGSFVYGEGPYGPYGHFIQPEIDELISDGFFVNVQRDTFADLYAIKGSDGTYLNPTYFVSNEIHEQRINESKRRIKVPKPPLVQAVVNSLEEIFKKTNVIGSL